MPRTLTLLILSFFALSFSALSAHAQSALRSPQSKAEFCALAKSPAQMVSLAMLPEARIAFENPYGYFSTGLCWWHSHLQRASVYLAVYDPSAAKPTADEAYSILSNLYYSHNITVIPGYANFYDFTKDNEKVATRFLSDVEILATAAGDWIHGVIGHHEVSAANLENKMDQLYKTFTASPALVYEMLQMPGTEAHAWLVENIVPVENGYDLTVIDSNFPAQNVTYTYRAGQTEFVYKDASAVTFVPYLYDQGQLSTFASRATDFCRESR